MQPVARASSSSAVSCGENSITTRKRQMGMWLSLHQPGTGSHGCLYCNKRFNSLQAARGHQNAHRTERIESLIMMNKREDERRREIQEGKRVKIAPSSMITAAPAASAAQPAGAIDGGIDLELRLGVVPPKKVVEICGFKPTARVDGGGNYGSAVRDHPMPLRAGGVSAIAGGVAGGGLGCVRDHPMPLRAGGVGAIAGGGSGGGLGWNPAFANGVGGEFPPKKVAEICGFRSTARVDGRGNGPDVRDHPLIRSGGASIGAGGGAGGGPGWNPIFANGVGGEFPGATDQLMMSWLPPRAGGVGAGGGVGRNRAGEFPSAPDQWMMACLLASKTSKKDLDLNLKL